MKIEHSEILDHYNKSDGDRREVLDHFMSEKGYSTIDDFMEWGDEGEWSYIRWATEAVLIVNDNGEVPIRQAINTVSDSDSGFQKLFKEAERDNFRIEPGRPFARLLESVELRDDDSTWKVGATPKKE